jgi:hypothetical protein
LQIDCIRQFDQPAATHVVDFQWRQEIPACLPVNLNRFVISSST